MMSMIAVGGTSLEVKEMNTVVLEILEGEKSEATLVEKSGMKGLANLVQLSITDQQVAIEWTEYLGQWWSQGVEIHGILSVDLEPSSVMIIENPTGAGKDTALLEGMIHLRHQSVWGMNGMTKSSSCTACLVIL